MKTIPWEDKLTVRQKEVLIGSLLGDGRLECRSKKGSARFRIHHADSQRDLLFWKYNEFRNLVNRRPWRTNWYDKRNSRTYTSWFFHTKTMTIFTSIYHWFYQSNQKHVPNGISNYLTPLAIAVWIADDGCRGGTSLILNSQSFCLREQRVILEAFKYRYNIEGLINRDRSNFRLRFNRSNADKLRGIIRKFDIPILNKKFVPVTTIPIYRDDSSNLISENKLL